MLKPIANEENLLAGVPGKLKAILVTKSVGQKMEGHDQKLSPKTIFHGLRK